MLLHPSPNCSLRAESLVHVHFKEEIGIAELIPLVTTYIILFAYIYFSTRRSMLWPGCLAPPAAGATSGLGVESTCSAQEPGPLAASWASSGQGILLLFMVWGSPGTCMGLRFWLNQEFPIRHCQGALCS